MIIRIKSNSTAIELANDDATPILARLQQSIVVEADRQGDDRDGYNYQFIYNDRLWMVSSEDVEVLP